MSRVKKFSVSFNLKDDAPSYHTVNKRMIELMIKKFFDQAYCKLTALKVRRIDGNFKQTKKV